MPSRRAVLALLATAPLAGCGGDADQSDESLLAGRTLAADARVEFPSDTGVALTDDVADAEAFVLPADADGYDTALDALDVGVPVVFVGRGSPGDAIRLCEQSDRAYGLPSRAWTAGERVAAVVPSGGRLTAQYLTPGTETTGVEALPWAVSEVLDGSAPDLSPSPVVGIDLGWVRMGGRTDVGIYDRWDRVVLQRANGRALVQTFARVDTVDAPFWDQYYLGDLSVDTAFDDAVEATVALPDGTENWSVRTMRGEDGTSVSREFRVGGTGRRTLAFGTKTLVELDSSSSFSYVGNVRFDWRRNGILRDDTWTAHTPGRPVWRRPDQ
ncbi:hypothetical protein [Halogeometricum limi]|uniref:Uncharacterized protein n=1 Tax=Halogeometricum limi TaxID=555875 RepID=A0A1I6HU16_9EURY|nr:hypothetical protein [Halogeometricum limi]SFR57952.1 hypothetical protein SAMN04488124_2457 [Halogeometricum limi]